MGRMTDADKIALARVFMGAVQKAGHLPAANDSAPNRAIAASLDGLCNIIEACFDGDPQRAIAHAEDMPLRMLLAAVKDSEQRHDG